MQIFIVHYDPAALRLRVDKRNMTPSSYQLGELIDFETTCAVAN